MLGVADGETLEAVHGSCFARPQRDAGTGAAAVVASALNGNNRHPGGVIRVPWAPGVTREIDNNNWGYGGVVGVVPAIGVQYVDDGAAGVVGEAELGDDVDRKED